MAGRVYTKVVIIKGCKYHDEHSRGHCDGIPDQEVEKHYSGYQLNLRHRKEHDGDRPSWSDAWHPWGTNRVAVRITLFTGEGRQLIFNIWVHDRRT